MTFIASVVAKRGVAIIADSFVTSQKRLLEVSEFYAYLKSKTTKKEGEEGDENINIDVEEIVSLFQQRPTHTKDFEEKLFKYDKYTAITTAGGAEINKKRIIEIVSEISERNHAKANFKSYNAKSIETKVHEFCEHLTKEIKGHLQNNNLITGTTFIFTNYSKTTHKTTIYKIDITRAKKEDLEKAEFKFVTAIRQNEHYPVICDGQNRLSERLLFGHRDAYFHLIPKIVKKVASDFGVDSALITDEYVMELMAGKDILDEGFFNEMKILQLSQLSLQQAVNLACLFMRIEMDFQKYTTNIPTVGGVTKLAIIDDFGFKFLSGERVIKPDFI